MELRVAILSGGVEVHISLTAQRFNARVAIVEWVRRSIAHCQWQNTARRSSGARDARHYLYKPSRSAKWVAIGNHSSKIDNEELISIV